MTYAQVYDGRAYNCTPDPAKAFSPDWILSEEEAGRSFVEVPDGTQSGAVDNGDGTFTNPPQPEAPPAILSKTAFQDLAFGALGGGVTGMARFQEIMDACASGTTNDQAHAPALAVKACFSRYMVADTFAKEQVASFTAIMVAAGVMTTNERADVLAAWP